MGSNLVLSTVKACNFYFLCLIFTVPGVIGCLQALEAIKVASAIGDPLSGRMLLFDALSGRIRVVCLNLLVFLLMNSNFIYVFSYSCFKLHGSTLFFPWFSAICLF